MTDSNYSPVHDPTVSRSVSGVYPARIVPWAMLHPDGLTVSGVVPRPTQAWGPDDLLWAPPGTKGGPDRFGNVVDVLDSAAGALWVRAQLDKRRRYLDQLRAQVASGEMRLNAVLAALLPQGEADAAQLIGRRSIPSLAAELAAIRESSRRRMLGLSPLDRLLRVDLDAAELFEPIVLH